MENTPTDTFIFSPPFTSKKRYTFQMILYPNGKEGYPGQLSGSVHLVAREGDAGQTWPCPWKQITMMLMHQHPHIQKRMSNQRSVTTDPNMKATGAVNSTFFSKIHRNDLQIYKDITYCYTIFTHLFNFPFNRLGPFFLG